MSIQELIDEYTEIYDGTPWYGESIAKSLQAVSYQVVNYRPVPNAHSIADLCMHMLSWRRFVIEKLEGNANYTIALNSAEDWKEGVSLNREEDWQALQDQLRVSQREIIRLLGTKTDAWLKEAAAGKAYTNLYMLRGIMQHDLYHLGQIRWIQKG